MIYIRTQEEIEKIRECAQIVAECLDLAEELVVAGVRTREIDLKVEELIRANGAIPSFMGYYGYPASTCISINHQVVHGIPGDQVIQEGDIVGVDVGACKYGYHGDGARTFPVGKVSPEAERLLQVTREAIMAGIQAAVPGARVGAIGNAVQTLAEKHGYSVVRDLVGHGIGQRLHEEPQVPNYGRPDAGPLLRPGMVLAIEPMVNLGSYEVETLADQWTVVTKDGKLSAHFEHTVALTETGPEILTVSRPGESARVSEPGGAPGRKVGR